MHLMYVDESGDPGYPADGVFVPSGPSDRYVLVGLIVHAWHWPAVDRRMVQFKRDHGLPWDAELRSHDIRNGRGAFVGKPPDARRQLHGELLDTIGSLVDAVTPLGVVINKRQVDQTRKERLVNPSRRAFESLLEAYNRFLAGQRDRSGIVIVDAREKKDDANVRYFQNYLRQYSERIDARRIVEGTFFLPSRDSNLLQMADICVGTLFQRHRWTEQSIRDFAKIEDRFRELIEWPMPK
ncbi:MAG: DUF3800 domain-containing protein [Phycisphaerales bacterium]|nr:DUF3800 domain-containing protein [Phycisphaerales bacterium]